jgi:hypothetical protein
MCETKISQKHGVENMDGYRRNKRAYCCEKDEVRKCCSDLGGLSQIDKLMCLNVRL